MTPFAPAVAPAITGTLKAVAPVAALKSSVIPAAAAFVVSLRTAFEARNPASVSVQVVLEVTQSTRSPVVGADAKPRIVLLAVAALPQVVVKFPEAGKIAIAPAVPDTPRDGVDVHVEADELDAFGI